MTDSSIRVPLRGPAAGRAHRRRRHPRRPVPARATAAATVKAGNEFFMPGGEADREDLLAALGRGEWRSAIGWAERVRRRRCGPDARRARETGRPRHPHGPEACRPWPPDTWRNWGRPPLGPRLGGIGKPTYVLTSRGEPPAGCGRTCRSGSRR